MGKKNIIIIVLLLLSLTTAYGLSMEIIFESPVLVFNKSVGKDWSFFYMLDGKRYGLSTRLLIPIPKEPISVQVIAREEDSIPDIGYSTVVLDPLVLERGKETYFNTIIKVVENGGRYAGNEAQWEIRFSIRIVE